MQGVAGASKNIFSRHLDMKFDLPDNAYKPLDKIGTGAYGVVCSAIHKKSGDKVAIKKIPNAFQELTTAKRTYRELKILRHFDHDNIIGIREILNPKGGVSELKDVYVVMDLMESDLHQIIHSTQPFSLEHTRYFLYQILKGLKYIHSANVVHRDLKPSNLLVNENCELKIGDFGMARGISMSADNSKRKVFMTAYVATRWYRAPELLFSSDDYSFAVDMWSVGCIFAEMIGRKQIFPGKNPMHQLTLIVEALGMPPDKMLKSTNSDQIYNFFHKNFSNHKPVDFHAKYPGCNKKAIDLLSKMLVFNPEERMSVKDALRHPFLSKYHDPDDELDCLPAFDFSFEQEDLRKEQIRQRVGKMILKYQKNVFGPAKLSFPAKSDTYSGALQPTKVNQVASSKPMASQAQGLSQMLTKENYSGRLFKVPVAPASQNVTTMGSFKPLVPKETVNSATRSLCVTTEQVTTSNITDIDMKSASSEGQSGLSSNQSFLGASLRPAATSITTASSDYDMRSAKSTPAQQKQVTSVSTSAVQTHTLSVSPTAQSTSSADDVEMISAKGTPPVSSTLMGSNHLCSDIDVQLKPTADVTMQSARSPNLIPKEETKTEDNSKKNESQAVVNLLAGLKGATTTETSEGQGSKTISEDTKALIKAALMNSVKNKLRKDSTSSVCSKGGGKVTVTAQSRQREREEKRRQKLKRSQERQKKSKSKSQNLENTALLTDEDKSLLERWSKMQAGGPGQSSQTKQRLKSDSAVVGNTDESASLQQGTGQNTSGPDQSISSITENKSKKPNNPSVQMFGNPNKLQLSSSQNLVGSVKNVTQINMTMTANVNRPNVPNQRRIMPKETPANPYTGACAVSSTVTTIPSTFTIMTQLPVRQNVVTNPVSSQGAVVYAGNIENGGITLANTSTGNKSQTQYVLPQHSVSSAVPQHSVSMTTTHNTVSSVSTLANLQEGEVTDASNFQPISSTKPETSSISDQSSYRTRIYSDRETPSPPQPLSPPTYEQAMKAIQNSQSANNSEAQLDSLGSLDGISPFKPSPQASGLPFGRTSEPPDIASVIQQFSKQAVEDIYPPVLVLTPRGDGAGYGLSLDFEDLLGGMGGTLDLPSVGHHPQPETNKPLDSAPLSPTLLSDWLELRNLNVDDMQAVQQELGMTSPFNMADLASLGNISPPTKS